MYQLLSDIQYRGKYASRQEVHIQKLESSDDVAMYMNLIMSVTVYDVILDHDRHSYLVIHAKNDAAVDTALRELKVAKKAESAKSAAAYQAFLKSRAT